MQDQKKAELEKKLREDYESKFSVRVKEQSQIEKSSIAYQLEEIKMLCSTLENDKNEILSNYERDRALWDGKFQFLES